MIGGPEPYEPYEPYEFSAGGTGSVRLGRLGREIPRVSTATEDIVNCATRIRSGGGRRQLRNAVVRVRNVLGGLPALVPAGGLLMSGSR